MKKIYFLLMIVLMLFLVGCQESIRKIPLVNIENIQLSSEKEEIIYELKIQNKKLITDKNYIKQFNYYYAFEKLSKEQLLGQEKNTISKNDYSLTIQFSESNYSDYISILFEIELAKDGLIYSKVSTINIFELAKEEYAKNEANLIARKICNPGEISINFTNIKLGFEKEEVIYEISLLNDNLITETNYIKQFNYYYSFSKVSKEELLKEHKNEIYNNELVNSVAFDDTLYKKDLSIIFEIEFALDGVVYSDVKTINIYKLAKETYQKDINNLVAKKICEESEVVIDCTNISLSTEKEEIIYNITIGFEQWITEENYIKQFNYYYLFEDATKEELVGSNKIVIENNELTQKVAFTEENFKNNLSVIFEMELAIDGYIYSDVIKINITEFAREEYIKNEANLIARKICGFGEVTLNIDNVNLSTEKEEIIYKIDILNNVLITDKNYIKQFSYYYSFEDATQEELLKTKKYEVNIDESIIVVAFDNTKYKSDISMIFEIELAIDGVIYSKIDTTNIYELAKEVYLKDHNNLVAKKICDQGEVIITCTNIILSSEKEEIIYDIKIGFDQWITEVNYIKQFNYYYSFDSLTKEELIKLKKNVIKDKELTHKISFTEENYQNNLSIIFEMELAEDGFIYSTVKTINITDFARSEYQRNEANLIARKICGLGEVQINISSVKLSSKIEEIIYEISILNELLITENNYVKQFNYYYSFGSLLKEELLNSNKVEISNAGIIKGISFNELNYLSDLSIIFEMELAIDGYIYSDINTINITEFARSEYQRNEANLIARKICGLGEVQINVETINLSSEKEELIYLISILNDILITEKNYVKQFNYYYSFTDATKEELLLQNKNAILNKELTNSVSFTRVNYENNISIIFEIELAIDGYIYSDIEILNITKFARDTYLKDKTNIIAKNICEYNKNEVMIIDLKLDLNKTKSSGETDIYSYTYSNPSYNKITVIITLKEGYSFSEYLVLVLNDEIVKEGKYTVEGNVITYIFKDPNWSIIV